MSAGPAVESSSPTPATEATRGRTVLLVDDQPIVGETIRRMLADESDIIYHYCSDPGQALKVAAQIRPTVILQDLVMPDVDGLMLVRFFRKNPVTASIPIIVLSSKEQALDKGKAFTEGASDYLVKIPDKIELLARIRLHSDRFLAERERDDAYRALNALRLKLEESNAELQRLTHVDGLTGVANRRRFDEFLDYEWRRARRNGAPLSVALMDIDFFKRFNDTYGHQGGDECLRKVAGALAGAVRRAGDLMARYGGEEFAAVLPEVPHSGACTVAASLHGAVLALKLPHGASLAANQVTISVGVATLRPQDVPEEGPDRLVAMADEALYQAKNQGRNRFVGHAGSLAG
jgi:two-component system, chemotaxis family, response regulator WspR